MKIDDSMNGVAAIRSRETRKPKPGRVDPHNPAGSGNDSVEITPTSSQLRRMEDELGQIDSQDTSKVEAVRQAIADGSFQVDEEAVVNALVRETVDLLRRHGGTR